jgi:hypothetical protein
MSDSGFFGFMALCVLVLAAAIYLFKFQDSRPTYRGYEPPTVTIRPDPNAPGWFDRPHRPKP